MRFFVLLRFLYNLQAKHAAAFYGFRHQYHLFENTGVLLIQMKSTCKNKCSTRQTAQMALITALKNTLNKQNKKHNDVLHGVR